MLFADIVDSTGIYETLGDHQAVVLVNLLFAALTKKVVANAGSVVKTLGDGMVCQFASAEAAFRAAGGMQAAAHELAARAPDGLAIRVAFNFGPLVVKGGDLFGDTVNVCARLVAMANPGQVLTTQQSVGTLSQALRQRCRALHVVTLKGRDEPVSVFHVLWRADPDVTETAAPAAPARPAPRWRLKLSYSGETFELDEGHQARIGRGATNDMVIASPRASRLHAIVYSRDGNFMIADQSSNGTYLLMDGSSAEVVLRREEAMLGERGWIGFGGSAEKHGSHVLRYRRIRGSGGQGNAA